MAIDFNNPTLTTTYTTFLDYIRDNIIAVAKMDYSGASNIPDGAIRWNSGYSKFQKYDASGYSWNSISGNLIAQDANNVAITGGSIQNVRSSYSTDVWTYGALSGLFMREDDYEDQQGWEKEELYEPAGAGTVGVALNLADYVPRKITIAVSFSQSGGIDPRIRLDGDSGANYWQASHISGILSGSSHHAVTNESAQNYFSLTGYNLASTVVATVLLRQCPYNSYRVLAQINASWYRPSTSALANLTASGWYWGMSNVTSWNFSVASGNFTGKVLVEKPYGT